MGHSIISCRSSQTKRAFFALDLGMQVGIAVMLAGIAKVARHLPNPLINLPHKDYWLAPERRDDAFKRLDLCMVWLAAATVAFMIAVIQLTINPNLANVPLANGPFLACLSLYLAVVIGFCFGMYRRFAIPADGGFKV